MSTVGDAISTFQIFIFIGEGWGSEAIENTLFAIRIFLFAPPQKKTKNKKHLCHVG
jgi:hypothetical protein